LSGGYSLKRTKGYDFWEEVHEFQFYLIHSKDIRRKEAWGGVGGRGGCVAQDSNCSKKRETCSTLTLNKNVSSKSKREGKGMETAGKKALC